MSSLEQYQKKYQSVRMERRDGILQMTFHTNGGPFQWGGLPHRELGEAFTDIAGDTGNKVVIMTAMGDVFSGPPASPDQRPKWPASQWLEETIAHGVKLQMSLLDIPVPMISAINGPAWRHAELPLLCDIVLSADDAVFVDKAHFSNGLVPGDGVHVLYPMLLGLNRARYFMLTGQEINAQKALELGLVNEVMPRAQVLPRAWALAEQLARQPAMVLRCTRALLTQQLKRQMLDMLGFGLAMEGLPVADEYGQGGAR
ncbi:MAG: enoyl-CoA hydratase/isomerase family protein [Dehalococcoidia bacterium]|nr:enoyl-CoA hydratase/isomerase family protein [Dehalococcoidia bacterium]